MKTLSIGIAATLLLFCGQQGFAQQQGRTYDPNLGHYYMARQEIQVIDESPVVTNKTNPPGAAGAPAAQPLPKAGFSTYIPAQPINMGPLPKVENGVPRLPATPKGFSANAGKLKIKTKVPAVKGHPAVEAYKPYQTFAPSASGSATSGSQTTTNVKGNVLHWARSRRMGY